MHMCCRSRRRDNTNIYARAFISWEAQKPLRNLAFVMLQNNTLQEHFKCKVLIKMVAKILQLQYFKKDGFRDITNVMIHNWDIETSLQHNCNITETFCAIRDWTIYTACTMATFWTVPCVLRYKSSCTVLSKRTNLMTA